MATTCNITGYLYTPGGSTITTGKLYLTLQQDMVLDGLKYAPSRIEFDLSTGAPAGYVNLSVYPTATASPSGVSYFVEFDPTPADTSKPIFAKSGYWSNYWNVPATASATVGSFTSALRGSTSTNYLPLTTPAVSAYAPLSTLTGGNLTLTAADNGKTVIITDSSARTVTLPAPQDGLHFRVYCSNASGAHVVNPSASAKFQGFTYGAKTNGQTLTRTASAAGESLYFVAQGTTIWWVVEKVGTWA